MATATTTDGVYQVLPAFGSTRPALAEPWPILFARRGGPAGNMGEKACLKREYIEKTYSIIREKGIQAVSIRQIAKELDCSTASLYRYFDSLGELTIYSSVRFLHDYIEELRRREKGWKGPWEVYLGIWECFSRHSFRRPYIFNRIFFSHSSTRLGEILDDYYRIFPEELNDVADYLVQMLKMGDFWQRDYEIALKCVEAGVITQEKARVMNRICVNCYKGILKNVLDNPGMDIQPQVEEVCGSVKDMIRMCAVDSQGV